MIYIEPHLKSPFLNHLERDERIVWAGQPQQGIIFQMKDWFLIPFSLIWCTIITVWMILAMESSLFFALFGIPFVLVGIFLLFGRFLIDRRTRSLTYYAVTNKRVLITVANTSGAIRTVELHPQMDIRMTRSKKTENDLGTIDFGNYFQQLTVTKHRDFKNFSMVGYRFFLIEKVQSVYELIVQLQKEQNTQREEI